MFKKAVTIGIIVLGISSVGLAKERCPGPNAVLPTAEAGQ